MNVEMRLRLAQALFETDGFDCLWEDLDEDSQTQYLHQAEAAGKVVAAWTRENDSGGSDAWDDGWDRAMETVVEIFEGDPS